MPVLKDWRQKKHLMKKTSKFPRFHADEAEIKIMRIKEKRIEEMVKRILK